MATPLKTWLGKFGFGIPNWSDNLDNSHNSPSKIMDSFMTPQMHSKEATTRANAIAKARGTLTTIPEKQKILTTLRERHNEQVTILHAWCEALLGEGQQGDQLQHQHQHQHQHQGLGLEEREKFIQKMRCPRRIMRLMYAIEPKLKQEQDEDAWETNENNTHGNDDDVLTTLRLVDKLQALWTKIGLEAAAAPNHYMFRETEKKNDTALLRILHCLYKHNAAMHEKTAPKSNTDTVSMTPLVFERIKKEYASPAHASLRSHASNDGTTMTPQTQARSPKHAWESTHSMSASDEADQKISQSAAKRNMQPLFLNLHPRSSPVTIPQPNFTTPSKTGREAFSTSSNSTTPSSVIRSRNIRSEYLQAYDQALQMTSPFKSPISAIKENRQRLMIDDAEYWRAQSRDVENRMRKLAADNLHDKTILELQFQKQMQELSRKLELREQESMLLREELECRKLELKRIEDGTFHDYDPATTPLPAHDGRESLLVEGYREAQRQIEAQAQEMDAAEKSRMLFKTAIIMPFKRAAITFRDANEDIRQQLTAMDAEFSQNCESIVNMIKRQRTDKDLMNQLRREQELRKKYLNQVIELQGNIRVFCRLRPLSDDEKKKNDTNAIRLIDEQRLVISSKSFEFDKVFGHHASQESVFEHVSPYVQSCIDGYRVAILCYGQTGSGKTYTMEGTATSRGVNYRALKMLFEYVDTTSDTFEHSISINCVEVYNETVRDLLVSKAEYAKNRKLDIRHDAKGEISLEGAVEKRVKSIKEMQHLLHSIAYMNRQTAATQMNEHSSRSHLMLFVRLRSKCIETEETVTGKLVLVDLAGSERLKKTGATGQNLKEAKNINRSLSALGDVISALKSKAAHCGFRNSKLTYLLSDCLGGNSKCVMFANVSPCESDAHESTCTLQFAMRARSVQLGVAKKHTEGANLTKYKTQIEQLKEKVNALEAELLDKPRIEKQLSQKTAEVAELATLLENSKHEARCLQHRQQENSNVQMKIDFFEAGAPGAVFMTPHKPASQRSICTPAAHLMDANETERSTLAFEDKENENDGTHTVMRESGPVLTRRSSKRKESPTFEEAPSATDKNKKSRACASDVPSHLSSIPSAPNPINSKSPYRISSRLVQLSSSIIEHRLKSTRFPQTPQKPRDLPYDHSSSLSACASAPSLSVVNENLRDSPFSPSISPAPQKVRWGGVNFAPSPPSFSSVPALSNASTGSFVSHSSAAFSSSSVLPARKSKSNALLMMRLGQAQRRVTTSSTGGTPMLNTSGVISKTGWRC